MRKLFIITAIISFILMILFMLLHIFTLYFLTSLILVWSLIMIVINWIEPKIKEANKYIKDNYKDNDYYPDQSF